ncbi:heterokaryon incompatibility domain protein [Fusarium tjaetaba]|uniref:Heterokaryon incompatibility domain protein n=1 Tax=Fusarium tjaetaba TaxID=1567544 RepID=A0A8H5W928_9HYPO|nr:heterokaryon incompatibility domain protein [Fusarium tjaetaba]KAF5649835.1 heterokaryon incompatibility domain protein [Fusarium tjaetaba]
MPPKALTCEADTSAANLCQRRSGIDFSDFSETIPKRLFPERKQMVWQDDSPSSILSLDGVPNDIWATMCQAFKAADPRICHGAVWESVKVRLLGPFSSLITRTVGSVAKSSVLLAIDSDSCREYDLPTFLSVQSDSTQPIKLLDPQHVDLDTVNGWLSTCLNGHEPLCGRGSYDQIRGLRVIDVGTKKLKVAERDTRYVALSYVWGQPTQNPPALTTPEPPTKMGTNKSTQEQEDPNALPNDLPCTILDAMTITASLGFQYLWIDRYCIPQEESDSENRDEQIRQMDKVYRNAEVTIIAAPGEGPEYGLPGMGSTARVPQAYARIGNNTLISTLDWPTRIVLRSKWASRGWTYQEAICSRRRLIFTDQQVFFECQQMSCRENVDYMWPLREYNIFNVDHKVGMEAKWHHIRNYTYRQLTYDSDALNASLGLIRLQTEPGLPFFHFWGIPMTLQPQDADEHSSTSDSQRLQRSFLQSLLWTLCSPWRPARRRQDFPTWSWTAWAHEIKFESFINRKGFEQLGVTASIGYQDGSFKDFDYAYRHNFKPGKVGNLSKTLRLRGRVLKLMTKILRPRSWFAEERELFVWPMDQHEEYGDVHMTAPAEFIPQVDEAKMALWQKEPLQLFGILSGWIRSPNGDTDVFVLLLSKVGTNKYERVGHAILRKGTASGMHCLNVVTDKAGDVESKERIFRTERWLTDSIICDIDLI